MGISGQTGTYLYEKESVQGKVESFGSPALLVCWPTLLLPSCLLRYGKRNLY